MFFWSHDGYSAIMSSFSKGQSHIRINACVCHDYQDFCSDFITAHVTSTKRSLDIVKKFNILVLFSCTCSHIHQCSSLIFQVLVHFHRKEKPCSALMMHFPFMSLSGTHQVPLAFRQKPIFWSNVSQERQ